MTGYTVRKLGAQTYLCVERTCAMDPEIVGKTMGEAFGAVLSFAAETGIAIEGQPISVYHTYDPDTLTFRAGFFVRPEDGVKAGGAVMADTTPAGRILCGTHVGAYARLRETYDAMMAYAAENKLTITAPSWEIYVDDPTTTPEDRLRTDIFIALA